MPLRRGVGNPNLRLERSSGNGFELRQEHVVEAHVPLPDSPFLVSGGIHNVRSLWFCVRNARV